MKRISIIGLFAACATVLSVQAQSEPPVLQFGGAVFNRDLIMSGDFAMLSQPQALGTARAMAMGGAFTSLGADMSSMSLNPAGLGMYLRNEISFTPMVSFSQGDTEGTQAWKGGNKTRFSFANFGAALNVFESASSPLTSVTLGFGMNRIADFNTRYSYSSELRYNPSTPDRLMPTIAEIFGQQLGQGTYSNGEYHSIFPGKDDHGGPNGPLGYGDAVGTFFWPAILGYNGYMINVAGNGADRQWVPSTIGHNASVIHSMDVVNSGSINEFTLSAGFNINNIVYLGATLGIQSVYKQTNMTYQEEYRYYDTDGIAVDGAGNVLAEQLDYSSLWQQSRINGSGVNFKLGAIVRPVAGLRLGVAIHTPTFYSLDFAYRADIETLRYKNPHDEKDYGAYDYTPTQYDEGGNSWEFVSPTRLMFGASYTFGSFAIVSVDYERDWYNGIRVKNTPSGADFGSDFYKAEFKNNFCATNALRAGIEIRPLPFFALRAGGGYTSSMLKDESLYFDAPVATTSHYFSVGAGVNLSRSVTLDVAYQNMTTNQTQYQLFFSRDVDTGDYMTQSGLYDTSITRNFVSMTLGFRF